METNKLKIYDIHNVNINASCKKYCSKCLSLLGENVVFDHEGNVFCDFECKKNFYLEIRSDIDDIWYDD